MNTLYNCCQGTNALRGKCEIVGPSNSLGLPRRTPSMAVVMCLTSLPSVYLVRRGCNKKFRHMLICCSSHVHSPSASLPFFRRQRNTLPGNLPSSSREFGFLQLFYDNSRVLRYLYTASSQMCTPTDTSIHWRQRSHTLVAATLCRETEDTTNGSEGLLRHHAEWVLITQLCKGLH